MSTTQLASTRPNTTVKLYRTLQWNAHKHYRFAIIIALILSIPFYFNPYVVVVAKGFFVSDLNNLTKPSTFTANKNSIVPIKFDLK